MAHMTNRDIGQQLIVKADEVDQVGTAIQSPGRQLPLSALSPVDGSAPAATRYGQVKGISKPQTRPALRREGSAPPPPSQPPPPAPPQHPEPGDPTDSLSLPQLKHLVSQFPKVEQRAYAFQFADSQGFIDEIEEWFQYSEQDRILLLGSRDSFEQKWKSFCGVQQSPAEEETSWLEVGLLTRREFLVSLVPEFENPSIDARTESLECILYILCGTWSLTAGLEAVQEGRDDADDHSSQEDNPSRSHSSQVEWMHKGVELLLLTSSLEKLYMSTSRAFAEERDAIDQQDAPVADANETPISAARSQELLLLLTIWYVLIESARTHEDIDVGIQVRDTLNGLRSNFLVSLVDLIARLRWRESSSTPLHRLLHLFWKSLLFLFGDTMNDLEHVKGVLQPRPDPFSAEASRPVLTASPLDYHLFRQEITSKYPAYNPPLPLVPLELEHKSMLPPLPNQSTKSATASGSTSGFGVSDVNSSGSILHQPVHIATPAPSPPPSPIGPGGKAGKKQNYQTNQNFPFLYPPLDHTSNNIGGKGSTELQDLMVGHKWEGSDIPTSIIEAGQLFASRMRMTRAMRQLWRERELFLKFDRGWNGTSLPGPLSTSGLDGSDQQDSVSLESRALDDDEKKIKEDQDLSSRLDAVEDFYHHAMPQLQSLIIVMMKTMVKIVQDIALQNGGLQEGGPLAGLARNKSNVNMNQMQNLPVPPPPPQVGDLSIGDLDTIRLREIIQKSISGSVFILLKWFKISHVLKFEYLSQLLLDSNYLPIVLKYFAHQNLEDMVAIKYDHEELGFFRFCHLNSDHPPLSPTSPQAESDTSSSEEAAPPPISRHRRSPTSTSDPIPGRTASPGQIDGTGHESSLNFHPSQQPRPSVDELGNPLAPLPASPITNFSFRQFQISIHLLRILQKVTRSKAHRILLLVQYKSSQVLRRILRVPDPMLRLYVLKLFKSQVPYCGRKWRQSNMRVITAIYLHCRPELRDEWLAGMHDSNVEGEVDEAVPLEWAMRGLTYWWQKRMYADVMKLGGEAGEEDGGQEIVEEERDFFQRELDNMGWGLAGLVVGEDVAFGEEAPGANGVGGEQWEQGGPLNMEGW